MKTLVVAILFPLLACAESPLFNHLQAPDAQLPSAKIQKIPTEAQPTPNPEITLECVLDFPAHNLCAGIEWLVEPNTEASADFVLRFWDKTTGNAPWVSPERPFKVELWMPGMGHGSSPITTTKAEEGVFENTNVYFIMPGRWQVRVHLTLPDGQKETALVNLDL